MKILVYPHDLNMGGSQTNAIELAAAVSGLGHECIVFGRRGTLCDRVEELGLEFVESHEPGRRPSPRISRQLRQLAVDRDIDVVHGYEWPPGLEAAMAAERLPDVAAVCTIMSMAVAPFIPRWMPLVVGTQQISATEQSRGRLRVSLIEPPVDLDHNQPGDVEAVADFRRAHGLSDVPLVVSVSRLVPDLKAEGLFTAIETAGRLARSRPFQLLIVGDGSSRSQLEQAAEKVNRNAGRRVVVFTGELADPRPAYAAADVVLGMGGSALRALAFGRPLIVQGERGFFRTLTPESVDLFRWQGWYGIGDATSSTGSTTLEAQLAPLLVSAERRDVLGEFGSTVVKEFSLEAAARRQVAIYRDACAARSEQKRQVVDTSRAFFGLAGYYAGQRWAKWRGRQRSDDFNAVPVVSSFRADVDQNEKRGEGNGPILYFPGVGWDTLAGTDRNLATALAETCEIVWVDTPHSVLRRRDRVIPVVSHPMPNVVRLRAPTLVGVQRPGLRRLANRKRAKVARRYLAEHRLRPRAVLASTTAPMLALTSDVLAPHVYYATDDFVEAARLWGVSPRYLSSAREQNLRAADLTMAVTEELARHLQRGPQAARWLPNGADLERLREFAAPAADLGLESPIAGVVGQFNARTDLEFLTAVQRKGVSLLLVGPRWFVSPEENEAFERLVELPGVTWLEEMPRDQLAPYLGALDVGLTPYRDSMFNRRSYPLKTLEYLAAGIPVVASDVAPVTGLDHRFVATAAAPVEFAELVTEVSRQPRNRAEIQQSVQDEGWGSRASGLLSWLRELR